MQEGVVGVIINVLIVVVPGIVFVETFEGMVNKGMVMVIDDKNRYLVVIVVVVSTVAETVAKRFESAMREIQVLFVHVSVL